MAMLAADQGIALLVSFIYEFYCSHIAEKKITNTFLNIFQARKLPLLELVGMHIHWPVKAFFDSVANSRKDQRRLRTLLSFDSVDQIMESLQSQQTTRSIVSVCNEF